MAWFDKYAGIIGTVIGGLLVAIVTFWLSKNKQKAETKKLNAEADGFTVKAALEFAASMRETTKEYKEINASFKEQVDILTAANTALKKS